MDLLQVSKIDFIGTWHLGLLSHVEVTCTSTCVGIHAGRVEPVSPMELAMSRTEALQARRSCVSSLDFHSVISPSFVAEDSRSGEGFQACLDSGCPRLKLARRCGKKYILDQFTVGTSCSMTKSMKLPLHEQYRYTCKAEAATQFHRWHTVSAPYA